MVDVISEFMFDHIDNKHKMPLEKIKVKIHQYDDYLKDYATKEQSKEIQYFDKYDAKRKAQNDLYDMFVHDRKVLYDEWKDKKNKSTLFEMLNMEFKYEDIPDIYTNTIFFKKEPPKAAKEPPKAAKEPPKAAKKSAKDDSSYFRCPLQNLGNSCYINSILQYLIHIPAFNNIILHHGDNNKIVESYIELYEAYKKNNVTRKQIESLVNSLNDTLQDGDKFDVTQQFDASEFMMKLVDKMNIPDVDDLFKITIKTKIDFHKTIKKGKKEVKCAEEKVHEAKDTSIIMNFKDKKLTYNMNTELTKMYDGNVEEVTKKADLINCDHVVDIATNKKLPKPEMFPYTRTDTITNHPRVLRIMLTLFDHNAKKLFIKSEIPNRWQNDDHTYLLQGMVVHKGETKESGHYEYYSYETSKWYEYSDSSIIPFKETKPKKSYYKLDNDHENGVNIFYTNKNVPCPYILYYVHQ
jgi:ubiquitin C-terminal hydrolase